jgi:hypothetical protein
MIRTFWQLITIKREDCEKYPRTDQNIPATYRWQQKGQKSEKYPITDQYILATHDWQEKG